MPLKVRNFLGHVYFMIRFFIFRELNFIFVNEYSKICHDKLFKFKTYRDKHYSHIDRKRKVDNVFVGDLVDTVKIFLNLFDKIYSKFKNQSIFDLSLDYNLFEVKLKAFKYDIMINFYY